MNCGIIYDKRIIIDYGVIIYFEYKVDLNIHFHLYEIYEYWTSCN